jgi:hypothetical protein
MDEHNADGNVITDPVANATNIQDLLNSNKATKHLLEQHRLRVHDERNKQVGVERTLKTAVKPKVISVMMLINMFRSALRECLATSRPEGDETEAPPWYFAVLSKHQETLKEIVTVLNRISAQRLASRKSLIAMEKEIKDLETACTDCIRNNLRIFTNSIDRASREKQFEDLVELGKCAPAEFGMGGRGLAIDHPRGDALLRMPVLDTYRPICDHPFHSTPPVGYTAKRTRKPVASKPPSVPGG